MLLKLQNAMPNHANVYLANNMLFALYQFSRLLSLCTGHIRISLKFVGAVFSLGAGAVVSPASFFHLAVICLFFLSLPYFSSIGCCDHVN